MAYGAQLPLFALRPLLIAAVAALAVTQADASGEIYKYIAEDGSVTYTYLKPHNRPYARLEPSCLLSYINCKLAHSDWSRVPLNRTAFRDQIAMTAFRHGIDPALLRALVHAESNFDQRAKSRAGAQGLTQLMPDVQRKYGVNNPYDPNQSLDGGARLLKTLLAKYSYDVRLAAAAYNAGEEAVARYRGIPPYNETRNYVKRVTVLYERYQNGR